MEGKHDSCEERYKNIKIVMDSKIVQLVALIANGVYTTKYTTRFCVLRVNLYLLEETAEARPW